MTEEADSPSSNRANEAIGFIGLGLLGSAIAERLVEQGYGVFGYDLGRAKSENVVLFESPKSILARCSTIILSLPDSGVVESVLKELDDSLEAGRHVIIDTTTGDPEDMIGFHEQLAQQGVGYIEAKIAGSSVAARQGDALMLLGGNESEIEANRQLLNAISETSFVLGGAGMASKFKLVHNMMLGLNRAVLAETLEFGKSLGFEAKDTLDVLLKSPAASHVMVTKGDRMAEMDFDDPQARLSQHLKDVRLIIESAKRVGAQTPLSDVHKQLLEELESSGYGDSDNSAIIAAFQKRK